MKQDKKNRTLVHLVNLVGHSGTSFYDAVEMKNISIRLKGSFIKATSFDGKQVIPTRISNVYTQFTIPTLKEYYAETLYK
jgi:hypothetical protein